MVPLREVQAAIARTGLKWEAGTTPIGTEFSAGHVRGFGFAPKGREPSGGRGSILSQSFAFKNGPSNVDWRHAEGGNYISPIGDQGNCGSCVAFATCSTLESRAKIQSTDPNYEIELSKAHLFFCGTTEGCERGWMPGLALKRCRAKGVGEERNFRYQAKQMKCSEIDSVIRVPRWRVLTDSGHRREALWRHGPVIGGMVVYGDFLWYRSGIYRPTTNDDVGLHCICIIGYDDENACWIIKNSWGTAWGEGGFGRIGYGSCGLDAQFPFYDPAVEIIKRPIS